MADLTGDERATLLRLARSSIEDALDRARVLPSALEAAVLTPALLEVRGSFVTLREKSRLDESGAARLRGCIGTVDPTEPLYKDVIKNAAHAAFDDPRFSPVEAADVSDLSIEISALTRLTPIEGPDAIVLGRDGVEMRKGGHRAVFLPQVATEHGWDRERLLEQLARKAGLPANGWKDAQLWTFRAEAFEERS